MQYFSSFLVGNGNYSQMSSFQFSDAFSSFVFKWGVKPDIYTAKFFLEHISGTRWLLGIKRDDCHSTTGFSISIHKALEHDSRFSRIRWFTEEESVKKEVEGLPRPY
jgi:hypothetical protein